MKKGDYVVVRGNRSGVFAGTLVEHNGSDVTLSKVRKLWYWEGACAVEQIAMDGVAHPENCKFTIVVDEMTICDANQILPATKKAQNSIMRVKAWKK